MKPAHTSQPTRLCLAFGVILATVSHAASAQSSSLYVTEPNALQRQQQMQRQYTQRPQLRPHALQQPAQQSQRPQLEEQIKGRIIHRELQAVSYAAVRLPEPRHFAQQDLITIIIREQTQASSSQGLSTSKEVTVGSELEAMPRLQLEDLLNFQLRGGDEEDLPEFALSHTSEFDGEGDYSRRDSMTTRLTARVIDVKPNGTLALEARTYIRTDGETQTIVVTGYARSDDITGDNSVLSTQMYDLRVEREHTGELRRSSEKGILTRLIDTVLNF
ncbi:MAG: flagellar basal body L-ring protein FlgH [Phycisphaeraceae bacterium]